MHVNGGAGSGYSWSLAGRSLHGNLVRPDYTVNESGSGLWRLWLIPMETLYKLLWRVAPILIPACCVMLL